VTPFWKHFVARLAVLTEDLPAMLCIVLAVHFADLFLRRLVVVSVLSGGRLDVAPCWHHFIASLAEMGKGFPAEFWAVLAVYLGGKVARRLVATRNNMTPCWHHILAAHTLLRVVRSAKLCVVLTEQFVGQFVGRSAILTCDEGVGFDVNADRGSRSSVNDDATPWWRVRFLAVTAEVIPTVLDVVCAKHLALGIALLSADKRRWVKGQGEDGGGEQSHQPQSGDELQKHCAVDQAQVTVELQEREGEGKAN